MDWNISDDSLERESYWYLVQSEAYRQRVSFEDWLQARKQFLNLTEFRVEHMPYEEYQVWREKHANTIVQDVVKLGTTLAEGKSTVVLHDSMRVENVTSKIDN